MEISKFISDFFTERVWVGILLAGLILAVIAYFWLAIRAVKASKWWLPGFIPPLALLYLLSGSRRVVAPLLLLLVGVAVAATPFVATKYVMPLLPRHPWESNVDGKLHVTLTGLPNFTEADYGRLKARPEIAVLQMANPEVDDNTLDNLAGFVNLEELDISNSKITDAGLAKLKALPKLKTLRLAHVKTITDEGFKLNIAPLDGLLELDVRDTDVKGSTLRQWKKGNDQRKGI